MFFVCFFFVSWNRRKIGDVLHAFPIFLLVGRRQICVRNYFESYWNYFFSHRIHAGEFRETLGCLFEIVRNKFLKKKETIFKEKNANLYWCLVVMKAGVMLHNAGDGSDSLSFNFYVDHFRRVGVYWTEHGRKLRLIQKLKVEVASHFTRLLVETTIIAIPLALT